MEKCTKKFKEKPDECPACGRTKFVRVTDFRYKDPERWVCENCNYS